MIDETTGKEVETDPTDEEKVEDVANRMDAFRSDMHTLVQSYLISADAEIIYNTKGIQCGMVMSDMKYKDAKIDDSARMLLFQRLQDLSNAVDIANDGVPSDVIPEEEAKQIKRKKNKG